MQSRFFKDIFAEPTLDELKNENPKAVNQNSESGFSHSLYMPFDVLQAQGIAEDEMLESPLIFRTSSDAMAHNEQKKNPATDEKIQEMMGFLNEDEGDCLFGIA